MTIIHPLAARLADAQARLSAAAIAHQDATRKVEDIWTKQSVLEAHRRAISTRRIAGTATDQDAAEFEALTSDAALLAEMLKTALDDQTHADPSNLRIAVSQAEFNWNHHQDGERLAALAGKAQEVDALLVRLIGEIRQAGAAVKKYQLAECWAPSRALYECIGRDFAPSHIAR